MNQTRSISLLGALAGMSLILSPDLQAQVSSNIAPAYRMVDLGILPGAVPGGGMRSSYATAINNANQVIGQSTYPGYATAGTEADAGFIWDVFNGMRDLGRLTDFSGVTNYVVTMAANLNNQGDVVGSCAQSGGYWEAYTWNSANGIKWFGAPGYELNDYYAYAINDGDAIAYMNSGKSYYVSGGIATWTGELYSGGGTSPTALNNKNEMVGECIPAGNAITPWTSRQYVIQGPGQAFYWSAGSGIIGLGFLPGYTSSEASWINDASQAVGVCYNSDGSSTAFLWSSSMGMTRLETTGLVGANAVARSINLGGVAVGYCQVSGTNHAIAWGLGQDAVDLNSLVTNDNCFTSISAASGINDYGVIVGYATATNGATHACILYPVNPAAAPVTMKAGMFAGLIISNAAIGSTYLIQGTSNLAGTNWLNLSNVLISTQPYIYIDYNSYTNSQQFYRAVPQ